MGTLVRDEVDVSPSVEHTSQPAERIAWEYLVVQAAMIWLVSRLALISFTFFSLILTYREGTSRASMLNAWFRYDAINYVNIATQGYVAPKDSAFFPLYPMLIYGGSFLFGNTVLIAVIISNLGTLAACIGLARLSVDEGGDEHTARWSVLALLSWPLGFFLAAGYTEGIFLAFAVWCLWSMRRGHLGRKYWYLAATCAFFGTLTRSTGVILFLPLLYEFARQHGWVEQIRKRTFSFCLDRADISPLVAIVAAIPLAFGLFSGFCLLRYGDVLMWVHIQIQWDRVSMPIWDSIWKTVRYHLSFLPLSYFQGHTLIDSLPFLVIVIVAIIGARRLPLAFTLYLAGLIFLILSSPREIADNAVYLVSAGRFSLAALPAFLLIGRWSERLPGAATFFTYGGVLLQAAFLAFFITGGLLI
ncbi:MAG TPA: glycosyltransferase family 39 protein [Ktedonobacterales bacterium]|jgi:hypothetical protein